MKDTILFSYDREMTVKSGQFTVTLVPAERTGNNWRITTQSRIFFVKDLPRVAESVPDKALFKTALESEMAQRKIEGRFFSKDQEFTRLRIANRHLYAFVSACQKKRLLVHPDGAVTSFRLTNHVLPEIGVDHDRLTLFIGGKALSDEDLFFTALPVTLLRGRDMIQLVPSLAYSFLKSIPVNTAMPAGKRQELLAEYARQPDKIRIRSTGKRDTAILRNIRPKAILNFDDTLKKAELVFEYQGVMVVETDRRNPVYDQHNALEIHRDPAREDQVRTLLLSLGFFHREGAFPWFLSLQTLDGVMPALQDEGVVVRMNRLPLVPTQAVRWKITADTSRIYVGGRVISGDEDFEAHALMQAYRENRPWYKRPDGSSGLIGQDLRKTLDNLSGHGNIKGGRVTFKRSDFAYVSHLADGFDTVETDRAFEDLRSFAVQFDGIRRYTVPPNLAPVLRPYQVLGFNWLRTLRDLGLNGILADDMGLGKSLQVLTLIQSLAHGKHLSGPVLLIAPKTLLFNWELEIKKFAPDLSHYVFAGPGRVRESDFLKKHHIILTSYGLLRTEIILLCGMAWDCIILDEAQAIKNPFALVSKAVKKIPCQTRLSLTGTPVENAPTDLWSQFDFLMPGFLKGLKAFKDTYGTSTKELSELRRKTKPYILRRLKSQVLSELPPKTDVTLYCDFTEVQKSVYDQALDAARLELRDIRGKSSFKMLRLILRLRLIACHPDLAIRKGRHAFTSGKLETVFHAAMEILSEGHKILIFSQFTRHLKLVEKQFSRLQVPCFYLDGKTPDRGKVVQAFQDHSGPGLFFISLKTGGTGLNLSQATYVFLLDPWWNPAVENQAIDRCHRMGQTRAVTVYRFITKGSIEEKVNELKTLKKTMEETLIAESVPDAFPLDAAALSSLFD